MSKLSPELDAVKAGLEDEAKKAPIVVAVLLAVGVAIGQLVALIFHV